MLHNVDGFSVTAVKNIVAFSRGIKKLNSVIVVESLIISHYGCKLGFKILFLCYCSKRFWFHNNKKASPVRGCFTIKFI